MSCSLSFPKHKLLWLRRLNINSLNQKKMGIHPLPAHSIHGKCMCAGFVAWLGTAKHPADSHVSGEHSLVHTPNCTNSWMGGGISSRFSIGQMDSHVLLAQVCIAHADILTSQFVANNGPLHLLPCRRKINVQPSRVMDTCFTHFKTAAVNKRGE